MSWDPKDSVVRVLGPRDATANTGTAGTAFFVTEGEGCLLATCAHVVRDDAQSQPGGFVRIAVGAEAAGSGGDELQAYVEPAYWREPDAEDIALLRLEGSIPAGYKALDLAPVLDERGDHRSWGFPIAKAAEGLAATVSNIAPASEAGIPALQARSEEVSHGFSGAPVWDAEADVAIGMVMSIVGKESDVGGRQQTTFFLRPAEELWKVCPELRGAPENPYRGLAVFEEGDAPVYYGRDKAISLLMRRLTETDFVAVVGPSGSGKSSLVRAGLKKGLDARPIVDLVGKPRIAFRPGATPMLDLALAVAQTTTNAVVEGALGLVDGALELADELGADESGRQQTARELLALGPPVVAAGFRAALATGAILIADQFERLFTDCLDSDARRQFTDTLLTLAGEDVKVLLTLRADFYGRVLALPAVGQAVDSGQVTVLPMTHDELLQAVVEPARTHRRPLEHGLAELLVDDVEGNPGDLPLLQLALTELWISDAPSGVLRTSTYQALGAQSPDGEPLRVRGVVARLAEERWRGLPSEQRPAAMRLLLSLVAPAHLGSPPGTAGQASRRAWRLEWDDAMHAVADEFVDARLLTTSTDAASGQPTVEVAHEALIWAWPRLRRLAEQHAEFLRWYDGDLAPFLRRWQDAGAPKDLLVRGEALVLAERWLTTARDLFPGPAAEFVVRSVEQRDADADERRRDAERERERLHALRLSESLRLASEARQAAAAEPETALLVAWEALLRDQNALSEAVFRETLGQLPAAVRILKTDGDSWVDVGFLSDGMIYAASSEAGSAALWDSRGEPVATYRVGGTGTMSVAARRQAPGLLMYRDGVLRLYDGAGAELDTVDLAGAEAPVGYNPWQGISVADDDTCLTHVGKHAWLATVTDDRLALVRPKTFVAEWSDKGFEYDETLHRPGATLFRVRLDRHGQTIISEGEDQARVWDVNGVLRAVLQEAAHPASACVLADGTILTGTMGGGGASWDGSGALRRIFREEADGRDLFIEATDPSGLYAATSVNTSSVIDVRDGLGEPIATLAGHDGHVWSAAFSADGKRLATGGADRTVRVWDWATERELSVLRGHAWTVNTVAFHPTDPCVLISADQKGAVRLWRLDEAVVPPYEGHRGQVQTLVRTAAGVLSSANDDITWIWSPTGAIGSVPGRLLAWRPSRTGACTFVVTADTKGDLRLWSLEHGTPVERCVVRRTGDLGNVAIAADGAHFAGVQGARVWLWSAAGDRICNAVGSDDPMVESPHKRVVATGFNPDGSRLAVASENGMVWLWTVDGQPIGMFLADHASPDRIFDMALDPHGELIATGVRNEVGLWDWDGNRVGRLPVSGYKVFRVAFSPEGSTIVTISDNPGGEPFALPEFWKRSGERVAPLNTLETSVHAVPVYDAAGRYFCLPSGRGIAVVNAAGRRLTTVAGAPGTSVVATALSPTGDLVAVAFSDGLVRLWSFGQSRPTMTLHVGEAYGLAFAVDGRELLCGSGTGPINRHPLDVRDLFSAARSRLDRSLAPEELERFGIDAPMLDALRT